MVNEKNLPVVGYTFSFSFNEKINVKYKYYGSNTYAQSIRAKEKD